MEDSASTRTELKELAEQLADLQARLELTSGVERQLQAVTEELDARDRTIAERRDELKQSAYEDDG